jgi:hypothetical protein
MPPGVAFLSLAAAAAQYRSYLMHKFAMSLAALGLSATAALAQTPTTFADVDTDANGELSFAELAVVWTDLTEAEFNLADGDASSGLNVDELNSLQPATVPTPAPLPDAPQ